MSTCISTENGRPNWVWGSTVRRKLGPVHALVPGIGHLWSEIKNSLGKSTLTLAIYASALAISEFRFRKTYSCPWYQNLEPSKLQAQEQLQPSAHQYIMDRLQINFMVYK